MTASHKSIAVTLALRELRSYCKGQSPTPEASSRTDRDDPSEYRVRSNERDVSSGNTSFSFIINASFLLLTASCEKKIEMSKICFRHLDESGTLDAPVSDR